MASLARLEDAKISEHMNICPSDILVNLRYHVKLLSVNLVRSRKDHYFSLLGCRNFDKEVIYLSPALLEGLSERQLYPYHNADKSNVFALGIIIVELALLESCRPCYNLASF